MKKSTVFFLLLITLVSATAALGAITSNTGAQNWSSTGAWVGGVVPTSSDAVIIANGTVMTVDGAFSCASLQINVTGAATNTTVTISSTNSLTVGGGTGAVTFSGSPTNGNNFTLAVNAGSLSCGTITFVDAGGSGATTLSVSTGTVTVTGNIATGGNKSNITFTGSGTLNISGNLDISGGLILTPSTGTVNFNGTSAQTITGPTGNNATMAFSTLKINNSAGVTYSSATASVTMTISSALTIGDVTANSVFSDGGHQILLTSTPSLNLTSGTVKLGSSSAATTLPGFNLYNISSGATVEYASGQPQTVSQSPTYKILKISGAGVKTAGNNLTIAEDLNVSAGTLSLSTFTANRSTSGGTLTVASGATLDIGGTNSFPSNYTTHSLDVAGTVAYSGTAQSVSNEAYGNLTLSGSGTKTMPGSAMTLAGTFTTAGTASATAAAVINFTNVVLGTGATFNGSTFTHNVTGDWTNNGGTFAGSTSTITFNGSGAQAINGTAASQTFNNVVVNKSTGTLSVSGSTTTVTFNGFTETLGNFTPPATLNISGTATLTAGTFTAGTNVNVSGDWTNNGGTFAPGTGTVTFNSSTAAQAINGTAASQTFNNLTVNKSGQVLSLGGSTTGVTVNNTLTVTAGTLNPNGGLFTGSGANTLSVTGTLLVDATTFAGNYTSFETRTLNAGGTVQYSNANPTIDVGITYQNLTFSGSGNAVLSSTPLILQGNLSNTGGGTLNFGSNSVTISGTVATPSIAAFTTSGTLTGSKTSGIATLQGNSSLGALAVNTAGGTLNLGSGTNTVTGNVSVTGGTLDGGSSTLNVGGNWANTATFTGSTSTVLFNGSNSTQTLTGTTTFNSVTVNHSGTGGVTATGSTLTVSSLLEVQAGTFTSSSTYKDIQIDAGAAFVSDGSQINVSGNWTNNGGTFTPAGNTVNFNGTGAQSIQGTAASQTFFNVTVAKTAGQTLSVGGSTTALTVNNWTETTGNFSAPATLTVNGNVTLTAGTFTAGATINAAGNWTNNGGTFTPGTGAVTFNGTGAQSINGTAASQTFNNLTVNKASNTLGVSGSTATLTVNGDFTLTAGIDSAGTATAMNVAGNGTNNGGTFKGGTGTVTLSGSSMTLGGSSSTTFNNLTTTGSITLGIITSVAGNLSVNSGTFDLSSFTANRETAGGPIIVAGTRKIGSTNGFPTNYTTHTLTGGTVEYAGANQSVSTESYNNLTLSGSGTKTLLATTTLTGDLTLTSVTLSTSGSNFGLNVGGNWTNNGGTLSGGTSTVSLTGAVKSIGGTASTTFPALSIGNGATITMNNDNSCSSLTFPAISTSTSLTHGSTSALTVNGPVTINQPTTNTTNAWNINGGSATVSGLITFAGSSATGNPVGTVVLTTGTLNANGGMTFTASAAASKVITMSGGAGTLNLKGALTVPAASSTLTAGTTSTFNYADNAAQTINFFSAGAYNNLQINNTNASGASLSGAITTANVTGNISVGNVNSGSLFTTGANAVGLNNSKSLTVASGSTMDAGTSVVSYGTSGTATINGTFKTANLNGFSGAATTAINSTNTPTISIGANSTIEYNAASSQAMTARTDYANLTLSSGSKTIGSGTVTLSKALIINSGATYLGSTNNPALNVAGDFTNSGTFTQGTGIVTFNGSSNQNLTGATAFNKVTVNNSSGLTITGSNNETFNDILTFTSGRITTGNNKVIISSTGSVSGAGAGKYVNGFLQKNVATGATARKFEIGDAANYTPDSVTFGSVTVAGNLTASTTGTEHPNVSGSGINSAKSVNRYWTMTNSGITFNNYEAIFTFVAGDIDGGATTSNFVVKKFDSPNWSSPTTGTKTGTSTQATGMTTFSDYAIGEGCALSATVNNAEVCSGNSAVLTASQTGGSSPFTYAWSTGATTSTISTGTAGTYTVTITDANSCVGSGSGTLTVNPNPTVSVNNAEACSGNSATLTATPAGGTGSKTFSWSTGATTSTISTSTAGTYSVTVTDTKGCTGSGSGTLTVNANPTVSVADVEACSSALPATLTATPAGGTGSKTFSWSTGATTSTISTSTAGTYSVTVTDTKGCTGSGTGTLTVNSNPTVSVNSPEVCTSTLPALLTATPSGGTGSKTFTWSTGATTSTISISTAGTYSVTVTDAKGCTGSGSGTLIVNPNPTVSVNSPVVCASTLPATLTATPAGGTGSKTFAWSTGATTSTISVSSGGSYSVTVTDSKGCTGSGTGSLTVNTLPVISCPSNINTKNTAGQCGTVVNFTASSTGSPTPTLSYSQSSGTYFPVGTTTVKVKATNTCGVDSCAFTVTVVDTEKPKIFCPGNITTVTDLGKKTAMVTFTVPVSDNCGATLNCSPPSGSLFQVGTTLVTCTATDPSGNTSTRSEEHTSELQSHSFISYAV